jgi:hypothetical protein
LLISFSACGQCRRRVAWLLTMTTSGHPTDAALSVDETALRRPARDPCHTQIRSSWVAWDDDAQDRKMYGTSAAPTTNTITPESEPASPSTVVVIEQPQDIPGPVMGAEYHD